MTQAEIINQLKNMTVAERLELIEVAVQQIRAELRSSEGHLQVADHADEEIRRAVDIMLPEYLHNSELTAFTALDGEDFYVEE
ncbi:MAG TPA: hypothetical protein VFT66_14035 [Roseiflexaceae bacterium]|jgi:hypothetical protein|nr:hypothetical protein [Roseiflexaceae bacterium]